MMTSTYIQRRIDSSLRSEKTDHAYDIVRFFNKRFVTGAAIGWIALAIVTYLAAAYSLFGFGISIQQKSALMKALTESNTIAELNLQQRQTQFAISNADALESMQKISDMRYVLPTDTAVSRADMSRQDNQ